MGVCSHCNKPYQACRCWGMPLAPNGSGFWTITTTGPGANVTIEGGTSPDKPAPPHGIFTDDAEVDAALRARLDGWTISLAAFRAVLLDVADQDMTIRDLRRLLLTHPLSLIGNPVELARHINGLVRLP